MAPPKSVLPKGYVFIAPSVMVSEGANKLLQDLSDKADKRCPDLFDMYIYNDYFSYGTLDLIDSTLTSIHGKIVKKDWDAAFGLLEALTHFMWSCDQWVGCDDGERTQLTNNVYGSLLVAVLQGLKKVDRLDATNFPSLECVLRKAAEWGDDMKTMNCLSNYSRVCRAIGWRLFNGKFEENQALEKARFEEWKKTLDPQELQEVEDDDEEDEDEDDDTGEKKPWYSEGKRENEDTKHKDLVLSRLWKEYKDYLKSCPTKPLRGPPIWDLDQWSHEEKRPFLFSEMDD